MSKDHTPGSFDRPSGHKSDLEIAETGPNVKSINTSFGSKNQKSGWHSHNYETKNNHPQLATNIESKGANKMERSNPFIEGLKVDKATIERCNEVSKNANINTHLSQNSRADGGRERGDTGPGTLGRESGYKSSDSNSCHEGSNPGHASNGHGTVSEGSSSHASNGHGNAGPGSGGHGSGGQGGGY